MMRHFRIGQTLLLAALLGSFPLAPPAYADDAVEEIGMKAATQFRFHLGDVHMRVRRVSKHFMGDYVQIANFNGSINEFDDPQTMHNGLAIGNDGNIATAAFACGDFAMFRFYDKAGGAITLRQANIKKVSAQVDGDSATVADIGPAEMDKTYFALELGPKNGSAGARLCSARHKSAVKFSVERGVESGTLSTDAYSKVKNSWDTYGLNFGNVVGLWMPYGLFTTKLAPVSGKGMQFTALPASVALGGRRWVSDDFYLGASLLASYAIGGQIASESTQGPSVAFLSGTAVGGLVDVDGFLYVAGLYQWNFLSTGKPQERDPGFMLGIGIGPQMIDWLSGQKK